MDSQNVFKQLQTWELILSGAMILLLIASFFFPPDGISGLSTCSFHATTGIPCPGCGMTRSFACISHGYFKKAWDYHPFGFLLYSIMLFFLVYPLLSRILPSMKERLNHNRIYILPIVILAAIWVWGIIRGLKIYLMYNQFPL